MPSYLDFDSTKKFRDFIIGRTLNVPNGPQTFNSSNYSVQNLNEMSNVDPGSVDTNRSSDLIIPQIRNIFKPSEYFIKEFLDTLPRRANLSLYSDSSGNPYFYPRKHNIIGIMTTNNFDNESELFKFAASYMKDNSKKGPIYARVQQNLYKATVGRVRLIDALQGNIATATNIITGKEPLIESNYSITVGKSILGKGVDFLQTVAGIETPFPRIPGDYFADPVTPDQSRPIPKNELGRTFQDITGAIGALFGIQRRPLENRKPSDLFIEYMGSGQKQILFDLLSYSKYGPDYTTTARSQNTSKLFNFIDKFSQGIKNLLGTEAPKKKAYIGDDRGRDVKKETTEISTGNQVRSAYYLSTFFDPELIKILGRQKNYSENGTITGNLTWYTTRSKNKYGGDENTDVDKDFGESRSTKYGFTTGSILYNTQLLLDSMPDDKTARSHVANVIDQTSKLFQDGDIYMSRGSRIIDPSQYKKDEDLDGNEFCRTWTKDRPYLTFGNTMKKGTNTRKFEASVMSNPWNLNIAPISQNKSLDSSTNIKDGYRFGSDADGKSFYAKKYMFSIENLAWKTSNTPGFTVLDLPFSERGPNGGRIMWFPPYDLKVNESSNARWESNTFLGRPEPIYTYLSTERSATVSFKVIVDHPSILNLLIKEYFKVSAEKTEEQIDNEINAFFAGCQEYDFYDLIRRYTKLSKSDIELILQYLNSGGDQEVINSYKSVIDKPTEENNSAKTTAGTDTSTNNSTTSQTREFNLNYDNAKPSASSSQTITGEDYSTLFSSYYGRKSEYSTQLNSNLSTLTPLTTANAKSDKKIIYGDENGGNAAAKVTDLNTRFDGMQTDYNEFSSELTTLKNELTEKKVQYIEVNITSSSSSLDTDKYNKLLSVRRSYSIVKEILTKLSNTQNAPSITWISEAEVNAAGATDKVPTTNKIKLSDLGWTDMDGELIINTQNLGETYQGNTTNSNLEFDCRNKDFKAVTNLNIVAPISFYCRKSSVKIKKTILQTKKEPNNPEPKEQNLTKSSYVQDGQIIKKPRPKKPPIDVMKRIIMKTLSETYYFEKLEETSPLVFKTLREKLKYFHPAFHSMTPEGLNSRLTFLLQCVRPGDTIPIKGISDENDLNARNTTFGPPPICVLRIGDFYHSKVVIRDVQITYEENVWDLNPEGIGIQPMLANVTLQLNFIGGQGLEKPVERLQNALSSNFFANTEIYDERSVSTNEIIGGEKAANFTREFLKDLNKRVEPVNPDNSNKGNDLKEGEYVGQLSNNQLSYTQLVNNVYTNTSAYFTGFMSSINNIHKAYGPIISSMVFYDTYRTIKTYDIYTNTGSSTPINLLGLYTKESELPILIRGLKDVMDTAIDANDLCSIFGFSTELTAPKVTKANEVLRPEVKKSVIKVLDKLVEDQSIKGLETIRNNFIFNMDKLNFVVKYGYDFKIENNKGTQVTLSGFTSSGLYDTYKECITYITTNSAALYSSLDNSINFISPSVTTQNLSKILSVILSDYELEIVNSLKKYPQIFDATDIDKLTIKMNEFIDTLPDIDFSTMPKQLTRASQEEIVYNVQTSTEVNSGAIYDESKTLFSSKNQVTNKLNYYKI